MNPTPIVLITFNRPKALLRRLAAIEDLDPRKIHLTVDGARGIDDIEKTLKVRRIAEKWASESRHNVEIQIHPTNLGIHRHLPISLEKMISRYNNMIVLEDDVEFTAEFIQFIDSNIEVQQDIFALQGFNPGFSSLPDSTRKNPGTIETRIPTVWGWAARSDSIGFYLDYIRNNKNFDLIDKDIQNFAKFITRDIFLQNSIRATWLQKMSRVINGDGGSWDNWWVLACWASGKNLLMPDIALSREEIDQSEGQTHAHTKEFLNYQDFSRFKFASLTDPKPLNKKLDRGRLRVWGVTRRYAWAYAFKAK